MANILIVEDDQMVATMLKMRLSKEGHQLTITPNGMEAKEILSGTNLPDLIITDINMPFYSGMELINYTRKELQSSIPILVLSTAGQESSVLQAFEMGANDFMTKPFSPNEVSVRIKRMLPQ